MQSIHYNRGLMRLCTVTHWRALARRRMLTDGARAGIIHFRLECPKSRLKDLTPDSSIGRHLWRVRTVDEWLDIIAKENKARRAVSSLELGIHHGDYTYLMPIPLHYLGEARESGLRHRAKWIEKKRKPRAMRRRARKGAA